MDTTDGNLQNLLAKFNLTKYEIKILAYLYLNGSANADTLAKQTSIPLSRIYDSVDQLVEMGFASASLSRPKVYYVVNPAEAAINLIESRKDKMSDELNSLKSLTHELVSITQPLYMKNNSLISPGELILQFSSLDEAEEKTIELIDAAQEEICIFTNLFNWFSKIKSNLLNALKRGVKIRIIMQENIELDLSELQEYSQFSTKESHQSITQVRGTIIDSSAVIFIIWANEPSHPNIEPKRFYRPQYSSNIGIATIFKNNFEYLWNA